jgi:hypothetical protein
MAVGYTVCILGRMTNVQQPRNQAHHVLMCLLSQRYLTFGTGGLNTTNTYSPRCQVQLRFVAELL